jgi:hypothetical protein
MRFTFTVDQACVVAAWRPPLQGRRQPFFDEAPAHPFNRGRAHIQSRTDRLVRPGRTGVAFIGFQQDAGMGERASRGLARLDQLFEFCPLLLRERDVVLFARGG